MNQCSHYVFRLDKSQQFDFSMAVIHVCFCVGVYLCEVYVMFHEFRRISSGPSPQILLVDSEWPQLNE